MTVVKPFDSFKMAIAKPAFGIGFKEEPLAAGDDAGEVLYSILCDIICGGMSPLYRRLYDEGLATYGEGDTFDRTAAKGFIDLYSLPVTTWAKNQRAHGIEQ